MKFFPIIPNWFINFADELIGKSHTLDCDSAVINRTIIDRFYYGSFLHVRTWIENNVPDHELKYNALDHGKVIHEINKCSSLDYNTRYSIASNLDNLRMYRNDATYVLNENYLKTDIHELDIDFISDDVDNIISKLSV